MMARLNYLQTKIDDTITGMKFQKYNTNNNPKKNKNTSWDPQESNKIYFGTSGRMVQPGKEILGSLIPCVLFKETVAQKHNNAMLEGPLKKREYTNVEYHVNGKI